MGKRGRVLPLLGPRDPPSHLFEGKASAGQEHLPQTPPLGYRERGRFVPHRLCTGHRKPCASIYGSRWGDQPVYWRHASWSRPSAVCVSVTQCATAQRRPHSHTTRRTEAHQGAWLMSYQEDGASPRVRLSTHQTVWAGGSAW